MSSFSSSHPTPSPLTPCPHNLLCPPSGTTPSASLTPASPSNRPSASSAASTASICSLDLSHASSRAPSVSGVCGVSGCTFVKISASRAESAALGSSMGLGLGLGAVCLTGLLWEGRVGWEVGRRRWELSE
ncbi:hypothetical protein BAUCODRAFT_299599 [Baudoinia panamericana UAMH 10762]|uniref:Uncharacterized protein n=1 Tax=Baudoinia panamericana (strain UAMH 10762) TaxID=717646 RepID=M2MJX8_BAUPA|nr:uncharacterized protein BAUCODRAFT_299599 [Baudoinia panamericana UAMH 10762]EMC91628.1 hypothetical protein BAUCODRAFT_299599 [Baudoinia panamericana UAMH 10762]